MDRGTGGQGDRETGRQGDRETGRQGDRETGRQGDRETDGGEAKVGSKKDDLVLHRWSDRLRKT